MPEYPAVQPHEPLAVSFTPIEILHIAHFVHTTPDEYWVEAKPVLGVFLKHDINYDGQVTGWRAEFAVQYEDTQEVCSISDYKSSCGSGTLLIGCWPYKQQAEPREEEVLATVDTARRIAAESAARQAKKAGGK